MSLLGSSRGRSRQGRRETGALAALAAALVLAPQLLGGVYPWGVVIIALLASTALAASVWANRRRTSLGGPLWIALLIALAWTAVQTLPLPCGLVRAIASDSATQLERVYALFDRPAPASCVLSRDPGATRIEVVKGLAVVSLFAAAALLVQLGHRRKVLRSVAVSGALLALVSLAHAIAGADKVFGVYVPIETRDQPFLAPLLNLNTLGGALGLCWPATLAFAIVARDTRARTFWLAAATAIATTVLMTRSRGAIGALGLGLVLFAALGWRARRQADRPRRSPRERLGLALAIATVIGISVFGSYRQVVQEFRIGAWDKLQLIAVAASFAREHIWIGIGRGAFSSTFAGVHNTVRRFDYPENFIVQWVAEWGLPVSAILLLALGVALSGALRRANSWERCAALAGVLGLAAQNLVDLGSELLAVACMAAVTLACAVCEHDDALKRHAAPLRSPLTILALAAALSAALLGPALVREYPAEIDARLRSALDAKSQPAFRQLLAAGMLAHPSEPSFALLAAHDALRRGDPATGRWINRALQLAPGWAAPHTQAAIWLWNGKHHQQALLELAAAARADIYGSREFACKIARMWPQGVIGTAGKTGNPTLFLELITLCPDLNEQAREALDRAVLHYDPNSATAFTRQARRAMTHGRYDDALALARRVLAKRSDFAAASSIEVEALSALARTKDALDALQRALRVTPRSPELLEMQLQLLTKLRDRPGIARALVALRGSAANAHQLVLVYHREAAAEKALGNSGAAVRAYQQAYDVGGEAESLRALAATAREMGDESRARRAYGQLCVISPADADSCASAKAPPIH